MLSRDKPLYFDDHLCRPGVSVRLLVWIFASIAFAIGLALWIGVVP